MNAVALKKLNFRNALETEKKRLENESSNRISIKSNSHDKQLYYDFFEATNSASVGIASFDVETSE